MITLITALEALVDQERLGEVARLEVNRLLKVARAGRKRANEPESVRELDRICTELGKLKRESIKQSLRRLVVDEVGPIGGRAEHLAKPMDDAYDVRSLLLHRGTADETDTQKAAAWLSVAVPSILERRLERACQQTRVQER